MRVGWLGEQSLLCGEAAGQLHQYKDASYSEGRLQHTCSRVHAHMHT